MAASARRSSARSRWPRFPRAAELRHVPLTDALELLLLLRDRDPDRYPSAALRWHGRLCREVRAVSPSEAAAVLALLAALADSADRFPARALAELLDGRALDQPARILTRWVGSGRPV